VPVRRDSIPHIGQATTNPGTRISYAAATGLVARLLSLIVQVVAVAIAFRVLGTAGFAVFVTISSLVSWLSLASLGVAPGLTLGIARASAHADRLAAARIFFGSLLLITTLSLVLALIAFSIAAAIVRRVPGDEGLAADATMTSAIMIGLVAAQLILAIPEAAQLGLQSQHVTNVWAAVGSVATLLALTTLGSFVDSVAGFVVLSQVPQLLARLVNTLRFVLGHNYLLRPARPLHLRALLRPVLGSSVAFAAIQLASYISLQFGLLVLAGTSSAASVSLGGLILRGITLASGPVALLTVPAWPTVADATARGDVRWTRQLYRRVLAVAMTYACLAAIIGFVGSESAVQIWTGESVRLDPVLRACLSVYFIVGVWSHVSAMTLVGLGVLRFTALVLLGEAVLVATLMVLLIPTLGVLGYTVALAIGTVCCSAWLLPLRVRRQIGTATIA
jgi:O-antigen/teichoic acid export membrane protein